MAGRIPGQEVVTLNICTHSRDTLITNSDAIPVIKYDAINTKAGAKKL